MSRYRIGSLFSGIGGLELGLERAGVGLVAWQCEADPFARSVLSKHWPQVDRFDDVRSLVSPPPADVVCGGFPCQDLSYAGKGAGIDGEKSGLFFELARIVRIVRPRFIVLENVPAITRRGLGRVLGELASIGYCCFWDCIPAAAVGAPHRRDRWFCVCWLADANSLERDPLAIAGRAQAQLAIDLRACRSWDERAAKSQLGGAADGVSAGLDRGRVMWPTADASVANDGESLASWSDRRERERKKGRNGNGFGMPLSIASRLRGLSSAARWEQGTPRTIDPASCVDRRRRLKALGNAVVPQVAEVVGRVLLAIDDELRGAA